MRAIARAGLSAALNNPVDGLVLAKWKQKVNLKEELILIPNIKDFKTIVLDASARDVMAVRNLFAK